MPSKQPEDQPEKKGWHVDKTVSITHLLTTLSAIGAVIVFGANMNTRMSLVEQAIIEQHAVDARQDAEERELRKQIREDLQNLSAKMDRILEKR